MPCCEKKQMCHFTLPSKTAQKAFRDFGQNRHLTSGSIPYKFLLFPSFVFSFLCRGLTLAP